MDIVVTSRDQDPANFNTNYMDSIDFDDGYEIAVKSIFHAPVFNITEGNNKFTVAKSHVGPVTEFTSALSKSHFKIPLGFYESRCEVIAAMHEAISDVISEIQSIDIESTHPHLQAIALHSIPKFSVDNGIVTLDMINPKKKINADGTLEWKYFVIDSTDYIESSLMPVLGYCNKKTVIFPTIAVDDIRFTNSSTAGFLYSNIVGNTMIDQNQSRMLAAIPMRSKAGHNYFEFQNPSYRSLSVHSITDMDFVITDVEGSVVKIDNVYLQRRTLSGSILPTILNLHIRKRL